MTQRMVVIGATGHIGRPLCRELIRAGNVVTVFSRSPDRAQHVVPGAASYVAWSPAALSEECTGHLEWADAVVYLAGGPLFDGRRRSREEESRTLLERFSAEFILNAAITRIRGTSRTCLTGSIFRGRSARSARTASPSTGRR